MAKSYAKAAGSACHGLHGLKVAGVDIVVHWNAIGVPDRICVMRATDIGDSKEVLCIIHALSTVTTPDVLRSVMHQHGMRLYPYNWLEAFYSPDDYQLIVNQCREDCLDDKPCLEKPDGEVGPPI